MADAQTAVDGKLKVFISYSRKDEDFAQELLAGLDLAGFEPYLDKHDIVAGEDWEARLGRLIEAADTVVFVISPDAVASELCAWEVERTVALKKRLLPVVWRRVDEAQVPASLKQLNYIFFDKPLTFVPSLTALATALRTDVEWIREHTRIGEQALRWDGRGRAEALLVRGDELVAVKAWLAEPPQYAPEPTLLHHDFINASEDAEAERASAERQRLEQMAVAQEEREKALEREKAAQAEHETALLRERAAISRIKRAQVWIGALFVSVLVGVAIAVGSYNQQLAERERIVADRERIAVRAKMAEGMIVRTGTLDEAAERTLKRGATFKECEACPQMVVLPAGEFMMGSKDGGTGGEHQHKVKIAKSFAVGKFEVTFKEWAACVAGGGCRANKDPQDKGWGKGTRPAINVSWDDARQYVEWLSVKTGKTYRLLAEAEWEYAARAGKTTVYSWGNDVGQGNANCYGCGSEWDGKQTAPVGSFKPNAFGLHDVHGNVWEWVQDCYVADYKDAPADGTARDQNNCSSRVLRGGSWDSYPRGMRAADRSRFLPDNRYFNNGFRVARVLFPARTP